MFLLDIACHPIREAFDATPYLVGTAQAPRGGKPPRDVDVRLILDDKAHKRLMKAMGPEGIAFLGLAIGQYLASITGLPIDFQIQQRTAANEQHGKTVRHDHTDPVIGCRCEEKYGHEAKPRNPLGTRSLGNYAGDTEPVTRPATKPCPPALRCGDRSLCPLACMEAGSRENPNHRPTRHPSDRSPRYPWEPMSGEGVTG